MYAFNSSFASNSQLHNPLMMHIDMNSCFATIEQQANPLYRGKPLAVAAYSKPFGCILAASYEAKRMGIKTGMRVKEGTAIYPQLIVVEPDAPKYRYVHKAIKRILEDYTPIVVPKSIDEFVLDFTGGIGRGARGAGRRVDRNDFESSSLLSIAKEIKQRIRTEVGSHITVSVGIGPNRFLAKTAADFQKPDGLTYIDGTTIESIFSKMELQDICGIAYHNAIRLQQVGIFAALDFLRAPLWQLKAAFKSVVAEYWFLRLRGFEIDNTESTRKTIGNSYILPKAAALPDEAAPVVIKLVHKMSQRLRQLQLQAYGIHLSVQSPDGEYWHKGVMQREAFSSFNDMYRRFYKLMRQVPFAQAKGIAVTCFNLHPAAMLQLHLFTDVIKTEALSMAMDTVNTRYGDYTLTSAGMMPAANAVPDRIAFGGVKELV